MSSETYKILYTFGYPLGLGGHFNTAFSMINYLVNHGHVVHVASACGAEPEKKQEFERAGAVCHEIEGLEKWNLAIPSIAGCRKLMELVESEKIQIIHSQDYQSLPRAYVVCLKKKVALVSTFPGGSFFHHVPGKEAGTIVLSREQVDALTSRYRLDRSKLFNIPARIDLKEYRTVDVPDQFFKENGLDDNGKIVFMATRFHPAKKHWFKAMIYSAEQLNKDQKKPVKFIIAGDGLLFNMVKKQVDELNQAVGRNLVHLAGSVFDSNKLNMFYNAADIVVGSGNGIMEAMAGGKPVIVLNSSGQGELVTAENVDSIAYYNFSGRHLKGADCGQPLWEVLYGVFQNKELMSRSGEFGLQYVRDKLELSIGARKLIAVYDKTFRTKPTLQGFIKWYTRAVFNGMSRVPGAICRRWCSARKND